MSTVRGIGVVAVFAGLLSAGCGSRSAGPALPAAQPATTNPTSDMRFEAFRAATEQQARRSAPAEFEVSVGSTYVVKHGRSSITFSDRDVAMKTASAVGFQTGSQASVYARADVTEVPRSFFVTAPKGRQLSTVHPICNPDGCPDSPPPPDPTPGPNGVYEVGDAVISSLATAQAQSLAATRTQPCTQTFMTNGYPGASMTSLGGTSWQLQYTPGYPNFDGGTDTADVKESVKLVDGTTFETTSQVLVQNKAVNQTTFTYSGGFITTVRYAMIQVIDHPYTGDNLIMGQAQVSCAGDSSNIRMIAPIPPPIVYPPNRNWWQVFPPA